MKEQAFATVRFMKQNATNECLSPHASSNCESIYKVCLCNDISCRVIDPGRKCLVLHYLTYLFSFKTTVDVILYVYSGRRDEVVVQFGNIPLNEIRLVVRISTIH